MSYEITEVAKNLKDQINVQPQLVMIVDGIPFKFGTSDILRFPKFDEGYLLDDGLYFDTPIRDPDSRAFISLDSGTSTRISQQLIPEKGGAGSVSSFAVSLLNKNNELTEYFTSGNLVPDMLGRDARIYLGFVGGVWPQDHITIFDGFIDSFSTSANTYTVNVAIPTQRVRSKLYNLITAKTTQIVGQSTFALFNGLIGGMNGAVELKANNFGPIGNDILITGDGVKNLNDLVTDWNNANTENEVIIISSNSLDVPNNLELMQLLGGGADESTINVDSTAGFIIPTLEQEVNFKSYIKIEDELIKLSSDYTDTQFNNTLRNQLRTVINEHDIDSEALSFVRLMGNPIELFLKILLSGGIDDYYARDIDIKNFVLEGGSSTTQNAIFFSFDIKESENITIGDICNVTGASEAQNNFTGRTIKDYGLTKTGSFIIVTGDVLVLEAGTEATIDFKSQWNTMPNAAGIGMKPKYVDLDGINNLTTLIGESLPNIDIYVKQEITAKEWIELEILKPVGLFGLNRKGRYSIFAALPPINSGATVFINETNITNINQLKVLRSTNTNFYNVIAYKFGESSLDDEFRAGTVVFSQDSINRIDVGNKQLTIEAKGLRDTIATRSAVSRQAERISDKYKFAPQYIKGITVLYKTGYTLEVGDSVVFGGVNLKLPDTERGTDYFPETLMSIDNKSIDINGTITIDLINSAFGLQSRFGVIAPSSYIESGSGNFLILKRSFATTELQVETVKWSEFIGRKVRLRSQDFSEEQILTIFEIADDIENKLYFQETITIPVTEDYILDLPDYDDCEEYHKDSYVFMNPEFNVDAVNSEIEIEADTTNMFIGAVMYVHSQDFVNVSQEVIIDDIVGNVITLSEDLNYLPSINDKIELVGFVSDGGFPYRYL